MKKALLAVCAAISSVALTSSTAFALCGNQKVYNGSTDSTSCNANGDQGTIDVTRTGQTNNYFYTVTVSNVENFGQGTLLSPTGQIAIGDRKNGTRGQCNEFFQPPGGTGQQAFDCRNANLAVGLIQVRAE
jgi:hypothetical protein